MYYLDDGLEGEPLRDVLARAQHAPELGAGELERLERLGLVGKEINTERK
jgi:hypothetical protein